MAALALEPGSELDHGKYRIVRLLGEGGMGSVYEALNTLTGKRVAIKWMHPSVAAVSGSARLVREAQAAARVRHRNAVDVYDVGRDDDTVFLVMEYLEGERLTSMLARPDVPMHRLIALLLPAMRAVAAAHRQGVIHRDIKPDNIFLANEEDCDDVVPKVLDFGISKVEPRDLPQLSLTRPGGTLGTPRYMSHEQLQGQRVDGRSDVYAFGVILYEALTGRPPFEARSYPELLVKVATQEPQSPKLLRSEIPSALARLVLWALARDRDARLPSMDALIRELEPFATQQGFRAEMTHEGALLAVMPSAAAAAETSEVRMTASVRSPQQPAAPRRSSQPAAPSAHAQRAEVGSSATRGGRFARVAAIAVVGSLGALGAGLWLGRAGEPSADPAGVRSSEPVPAAPLLPTPSSGTSATAPPTEPAVDAAEPAHLGRPDVPVPHRERAASDSDSSIAKAALRPAPSKPRTWVPLKRKVAADAALPESPPPAPAAGDAVAPPAPEPTAEPETPKKPGFRVLVPRRDEF